MIMVGASRAYLLWARWKAMTSPRPGRTAAAAKIQVAAGKPAITSARRPPPRRPSRAGKDPRRALLP